MNAVVKTDQDIDAWDWGEKAWLAIDESDADSRAKHDRARGKVLSILRAECSGDNEFGKRLKNSKVINVNRPVAFRLRAVYEEFGEDEMLGWPTTTLYETTTRPEMIPDMRALDKKGVTLTKREVVQHKSSRAPVHDKKPELPPLPPLDAPITRIPTEECLLPIGERVKLPFAPWMVLGLRPCSTINKETLGVIYKGLAHKYHPDKTGGDDTIFKAIKRAAETLGYGS